MSIRPYLLKTGLSSLFIVAAFVAHAQAPLYGIFAGAQMSTAHYRINEVKQPTDHKYGFQAGFTMKVPFETNLYFSPAAFYSLKGYKVRFNRFSYPPDTLAADNNTSIHTFELAFLLQFDMSDKPDHFFLKAGPSLDFQLVGKEKYNKRNGGGSVSQDMIYSFGEYGRYGANLLIQLGFENRNGLMIYGQYSLGLTNLNNADLGPRINHRVYGISIGKYLNMRKVAPASSN